MFGMAVADGYLDYNPFHDVKIPKVPGRRAIKIATPEQYAKVRGCLPTKPARAFSTLLVSSGIRFGQADLRTTARYVHVLDETGESAARRFEGLLPPL